MPGLIPTAIGAASNPTPGMTPMQSIGHAVLPRIPYYNIGGSIVHLLNGTLGQHGPSPSIIGRITQSLFPGIGQQQPQGQQPTVPGGPTLPTNSETNNPPMYGNGQAPPDAAANNGAVGPGGLPLSVWQQVFNSGRFTNAPAFFPTLAQTRFPGSAIGPFGGGTNPYSNTRGAEGLGTPNSVQTGIPGWASAFSQLISSRNQI